jgi:hypothetical protein
MFHMEQFKNIDIKIKLRYNYGNRGLKHSTQQGTE